LLERTGSKKRGKISFGNDTQVQRVYSFLRDVAHHRAARIQKLINISIGGSEEHHTAASIESLDKHTCNRRALLLTFISKQELRINFQSCEERELFCYLSLLLNPSIVLGFESISRERARGHIVFDVELINRSGVHKPRRLTTDVTNGVLERADFAARAETVKKLMIRSMDLEENLADKNRLWLVYMHNGATKSTNIHFPTCCLRQEFIALFKDVKKHDSADTGDLPPPPPPDEDTLTALKPGTSVRYEKGQKTRSKAESVHMAPPKANEGWAPPPPPPPKGGATAGAKTPQGMVVGPKSPLKVKSSVLSKDALTTSQHIRVAAMKDALAPKGKGLASPDGEEPSGRKGTGKGKMKKLSKEKEYAMDLQHLESQFRSGELGDLGLSVFVGTWNVGDRPPPKRNVDLRHWLGRAPNLSKAGWSGNDEQHSVPNEEAQVEEEPIRMSELLKNKGADLGSPTAASSLPPPPPPSSAKSSGKNSRSGTRTNSAAAEKEKVLHEHEHDIYAIGFQENSHKDAWVRAIAEYVGAGAQSHRTHKTPRQRAGISKEHSHIGLDSDDDDEGGGVAVGGAGADEHKDDEYVLLSVVSLWGIMLVLAVRRELRDRISGLQVSTEATGLMHVLGNKGAAAVGFCIDNTTTVAFVTCHLAARATRVQQRDENYSEISAGLNLKQHKHLNSSGIGGVGTACKVDFLNHFHHVFWCGDLNYRIDLGNMGTPKEFKHVVKISKNAHHDKVLGEPATPVAAMDGTSPGRTVRAMTTAEKDEVLKPLLAGDQLHKQMALQKCFNGFEEPPIHFPPTYRMIKGAHEYSNKKNQNPSYCDRVLWKSNRHGPATVLPTGYAGVFELNNSDHRAVAAQFKLRLIPASPCTATMTLHAPQQMSSESATPISVGRHVGGGDASFRPIAKQWNSPNAGSDRYGLNSEAGYGRVFLPSLKLKVLKEVMKKEPKKEKKDKHAEEEEVRVIDLSHRDRDSR
jgi:hypothetical protein